MRAAVPWSRYQLDLTRSPLILLSMPQHNATQHTHTHTLPTLCHQASAQPSNSSNRAKMAPEPFFCPWRTHTHTHNSAADGHWTAWPQCHLPVPCTRPHNGHYRHPSIIFLSIFAPFCPAFSSISISRPLIFFMISSHLFGHRFIFTATCSFVLIWPFCLLFN